MNAENFNIDMLLAMAHSPVHNYAIPGLTSSLIGKPGPNGTVRLFECSRHHQEQIVPHSHRFDFQCWVLVGCVTNRIWTEAHVDGPDGTNFSENHDWFEVSEQMYQGEIGRYKTYPRYRRWYRFADKTYYAGDCYSMKAEEIHSIQFSRGAKVLFLEGKPRVNSVFIEPIVNGEVLRTMQVAKWMFKRGE